MRVEIIPVKTTTEERATLFVKERTAEIEQAVALLQEHHIHMPVYCEGKISMLPIRDIYYIEVVDKKTFVYTKDNCFETKHRLYELERVLDYRFRRCSKSMIINIMKIRYVHTQVYGRMEAKLLNDECILISRSYVKDLKKGLGI
ncbi:MAG: LytTR family DNA-binding domain-containing protein [Lachnospiraceae bacterium]|nr:LytTR family DNA-binding domain-containing protein [Lachnospiraceae bacterium]MDY5742349.1 LytTR family DNA-binding domain-containing protein [Lachnospiraceae bacterium]